MVLPRSGGWAQREALRVAGSTRGSSGGGRSGVCRASAAASTLQPLEVGGRWFGLVTIGAS